MHASSTAITRTPTRWVVAGAAALVLASSASTALAVPRITRPVTDLADVLTDEQEADIARKLTSHRALTQVQIAVLTVPSTDGVAIDRYALDTARQWGGGNAVENNGVLYVLAVRDRRHHVEVGTGLIALVPDDRRRAMLDSARSSLRAGDHVGAVRVVVDSLVGATGGTAVTEEQQPALPAPVVGDPSPVPAPTSPPNPVTFAPPPSSENVLAGSVLLLGCFGAIALLVAMLVWLLVRGITGAARSFSGGTSHVAHGGHGLSYGQHDEGSSWLHSTHGATDTSSFASSDTSSYSSSDTASYSSSDTSSSSDYSGGGGSFGGGGSSSDW